MRPPLITFVGTPVRGSGRGKALNVPTINLDTAKVPALLQEGIYACVANINGTVYAASMHRGPRPVFDDEPSCEIHLLDTSIDHLPETITIHVVERLRDVSDFPSKEALLEQIKKDNAQARAILGLS